MRRQTCADIRVGSRIASCSFAISVQVSEFHRFRVFRQLSCMLVMLVRTRSLRLSAAE